MAMIDNMSLNYFIKNNSKGGAGRKEGNRRGGRGGGVISCNGIYAGVLRGRNRRGVSKPNTKGDVNSAWKHDMFNDYGDKKIQKEVVLTTGPAKLLVSNLDFGVSDSDMQELFSELGELKSAGVHYDRSGRSLGTAHVVFVKRASAIKAMKQYNGVPLDGRAMNIQLALSDIKQSREERGRKLGGGGGVRKNSVRGGSNRFQNSSARNSGRSRRGGTRGRKPVPTAEQLDAELDAYVKERSEVKS